MNKINFTLVFNRKNKLDKNGKALIYVRAHQNNTTIYFSTDVSILANQWNENKREIKNSHPQYVTLNKQINELKAKLIDLDRIIYEKQKHVNLSMLQEYFTNTDKLNNSFLDFCEIEMKLSNLEFSTIKNEQISIKALRTFKKQILFDDLNYELMTDFERYLIKQGLKTNTIHKHFRHVRKFVKLAVKKDRLDANRDPFIKFKAKLEETNREYLPGEIYTEIIQYTLPADKQNLKETFDKFVFSLFTGLRFSDIHQLKAENLKSNLYEGNYIEMEMQKTKKMLHISIDKLFEAINIEIPEENKPMNIIKRNFKQENEFIFENRSNQHVNRQLKEIAKLLNIETNTTFHTARHTIAMFLHNDCGSDLETIAFLLGHKKLETTKIYSKMSSKGFINRLQIIANNRKAAKEPVKKAM